MTKGIITVKEWFFDKINDTCNQYRCQLIGEYENGMLDHSKLRVDDVVSETEKAYQVILDAETCYGNYKPWKCWIPKSVIVG